jgi:hypothetical protein
MDYRLTHKQIQDRELLRELLGDVRNIAVLVKAQPNLDYRQRVAVDELLIATQMVHERLGAKSEAAA